MSLLWTFINKGVEMFENLSNKLQDVFRNLKGEGKISETNITDALREVKKALLEADVSLSVVKEFTHNVKEKALGQEVLKSLSPGQQFIKIVSDELINLLGGETAYFNSGNHTPTIIMLVGLHGSGKTTTSGKLSMLLRKQGKRPGLVALDVYRPAAIKQLQVLGKQLDMPVFTIDDEKNPVTIAQQSVKWAKDNGYDHIILDTAGRLHIDEELMKELLNIKNEVNPHEILLVVDAMIGQDAVKMASSFHEMLGITGIIMTKMDGDARGGAALSTKSVTGQPIKFIGTGEKLDALEYFHPDRIASRILGMGDILTLIEKAHETVELDKVKEMEKKLRKMEFTLEDFADQLKQVKKLGPLQQIMGMIPGVGNKLSSDDISMGEQQIKIVEAVINSMTPEERRKPEIINSSRKTRISKGSATSIQEVNRLLKQFEQMKKVLKMFSGGGMFDTQMSKKKRKAMQSVMGSKNFEGLSGGLPGMPGMPGMPFR